MKKTIIALMALSGASMAAPMLEMDFTKLSGYSSDCTIDEVEYTSVLPEGWTTGQWNGDNKPHYEFGSNGAVVKQPWKQNYIETNFDIDSQGAYSITFKLYNSSENTGNMFYLSSDSYSIVMGNSYTSNSEIYVGTLGAAVGADFVCFQPGTKTNLTVLTNSTGYDVSGTITYTLTMNNGNMNIKAASTSGSEWSTTINGMQDVTFTKLGFIADGAPGAAGVKSITVIPEPTTATLSLLALAGLAMRRRRK